MVLKIAPDRLNAVTQGMMLGRLDQSRRYILRDKYISPLAAGAVDATNAEPGPGVRQIIDSGIVCVVTNGYMTFPNVAQLDSLVYELGLADTPGRILITDIDTLLNQDYQVGYRTVAAVPVNAGVTIDPTNERVEIRENGATGAILGYDSIIPYDSRMKLATVISDGCFYVFARSTTTNDLWTLLWKSYYAPPASSHVTLYYADAAVGGNMQAHYFAVPYKTWLPKPIVSDAFSITGGYVEDYAGPMSGDPVRVVLDGSYGGKFNGRQSYIDLNGAIAGFNGDACSVIFRGSVEDCARIDDSTYKAGLGFYTDGNNAFYMGLSNGNGWQLTRVAAGAAAGAFLLETPACGTSYTIGGTINQAGNQIKLYRDGALIDTVACPGVWAGALAYATIGAYQTNIATWERFWPGIIRDVIIVYGVVLSLAQMTAIHNLINTDAVTTPALNAIIGAGAYSWLPVWEGRYTDGEGHPEGVAGGIGSGGGARVMHQPGFYVDDANAGYLNPALTGSDLLTDGDVENWTGANDLTDWGENIAGGSVISQEAVVIYHGASSCEFAIDAVNSNCEINQSVAALVDKFVMFTAWMRADSDASDRYFYSLPNGFAYVGLEQQIIHNIWLEYRWSWVGKVDTVHLVNEDAANRTVWADYMSLIEIEQSNAFYAFDMGTPAVYVTVEMTSLIHPQGIVVNLDDPDNPQNYILVYILGDTLFNDICVNGVITEQAFDAVVVGAGDRLDVYVFKMADESILVNYYYNGALIQSIPFSDATIVDNTWHGLFALYDEGLFENFAMYKVNSYENLEVF